MEERFLCKICIRNVWQRFFNIHSHLLTTSAYGFKKLRWNYRFLFFSQTNNSFFDVSFPSFDNKKELSTESLKKK